MENKENTNQNQIKRNDEFKKQLLEVIDKFIDEYHATNSNCDEFIKLPILGVRSSLIDYTPEFNLDNLDNLDNLTLEELQLQSHIINNKLIELSYDIDRYMNLMMRYVSRNRYGVSYKSEYYFYGKLYKSSKKEYFDLNALADKIDKAKLGISKKS